MQTIAHRFPCELVGIVLVLLSAAPADAKTLLLMQEGISLYETVTSSIARDVGADLEIQNLDALKSGEDLARVLAEKAPTALIAVGAAAARMVAATDVTLPVIFCLVPQRDTEGLKNVRGTGVALEVPLAAQLAAVKSVLPKAARIGVLYNPKVSAELIAEARRAASRSGVTLVEAKVEDPSQLGAALRGIAPGIDALWMLQDRTVGNALGFKVLLVGTLEAKLPLIAYSASFVESGATVAMAPDFPKVAELTVGLLKKVAAGAVPGTIPWQDGPGQLVINMKVAGRLGIDVPVAAARGAKLVE